MRPRLRSEFYLRGKLEIFAYGELGGSETIFRINILTENRIVPFLGFTQLFHPIEKKDPSSQNSFDTYIHTTFQPLLRSFGHTLILFSPTSGQLTRTILPYYHMLVPYYHMLLPYYHILVPYYHMLVPYYHTLVPYTSNLQTSLTRAEQARGHPAGGDGQPGPPPPRGLRSDPDAAASPEGAAGGPRRPGAPWGPHPWVLPDDPCEEDHHTWRLRHGDASELFF